MESIIRIAKATYEVWYLASEGTANNGAGDLLLVVVVGDRGAFHRGSAVLEEETATKSPVPQASLVAQN
jgi:hypothetical protein